MISVKKATTVHAIPDLTPLLDLVFIVMVFLLLTTNVQIEKMDINLPQTEQTEVLTTIDQEVITVGILAAPPHWALQDQSYSNWALFTSDLLALVDDNPDKPIVIAADKSATVETMLEVLAFLQKNQINTTNMMMENSKP